MAKKHLYDEQAFELAKYFLSDHEHSTADLDDLAHEIQQAVEDWFESRKARPAEEGGEG